MNFQNIFFTTTIITQNLLDMRKLFVLICAVAITLTAQAQKTKKGLTTQNVKTTSSKTTSSSAINPSSTVTSGKHYKWEIGLLAGSSVYTGDVHCEKFFLKALNFGGGLFARYYLSDRFTTRFNFQTGRINGNDVNYGTADHIARGFVFDSQILEASALLEYEPFAKRRYRGGEFHRILSPYVNVGVGYLYSMPKTSYNEIKNDKLLTQINADKTAMTHGHIALPFGAGIRYDLSRKVSIGVEGAFRVPFTDYLDGVSLSGNAKSNDWYYTGNVLLAYRFSHKMDSDSDGVNDDEDKCPNVPGLKTNKGCPKEEQKSVQKEDIQKEEKSDFAEEKVTPINESPKEAISETTNTTKEVMADSDIKVTETVIETPVVNKEVITTEKGKTIPTTPSKVATNLKQPTSTITKTSTKESAIPTTQPATNTKVETISNTSKNTTPNRNTAQINEANVISRGQYVDYGSVRIEAPGATQSYASTSTKGYTPTSYTSSSATTSNSTAGYFAAPTYDGINAESATTFREAMYGVKFKTGSAAVSKESYGILNRVAKVISSGNDHITISGHTDNQGCASENQNLSELRAFSIYKYLILKGIPSNRISYEGFGDSQPLNDNCAESGRAKNRRVEFRLQ